MLPRAGRRVATGEEARVLVSRSQNRDPNGRYGSVARSDDNDDDDDSMSSSATERSSPQQQEPTLMDDDNDDDDTANNPNSSVAILTRRLRCLFAVITWPIAPLGTLTVLALLWFLYAFLLDFSRHCSHPLKAYAYITLLWVLYIPSHTAVRSRLFSYVRERDGPTRPPLVRRYDQLFHTLALLYVYAGITLVQTCRDGGVLPAPGAVDPAAATTPLEDDATAAANDNSTMMMTTTPSPTTNIINTCDSTCPNLFPAMAVYVTTLEVFTLSLILPLLFLPCIYLWFLRQVTADRDLAILQEHFREEEEALLSGGPAVTAQDVMEELEPVRLVRQKRKPKTGVDNEDDDDDEIWAVPLHATSLERQGKDTGGVKDCCICMNEFVIHDYLEDDVEQAGRTASENDDDDDDDEAIVRTRPCGHLFHRRCVASWVTGGWQGRRHHQDGNDTSWMQRRAKRSSCPLCRTELKPPSSSPSS